MKCKKWWTEKSDGVAVNKAQRLQMPGLIEGQQAHGVALRRWPFRPTSHPHLVAVRLDTLLNVFSTCRRIGGDFLGLGCTMQLLDDNALSSRPDSIIFCSLRGNVGITLLERLSCKEFQLGSRRAPCPHIANIKVNLDEDISSSQEDS